MRQVGYKNTGILFTKGLCLLMVGLLGWNAAAEIDFKTSVEPLFQKHCMECHGAERQKSGIRLDQRSILLKGGDHGLPSIVPGAPEKSHLIALVKEQDPEHRMPAEGPPLSVSEIQVLEQWIKEGASWPGQMGDGRNERLQTDHWSFQPIQNSSVPDVAKDWARNPIDRFIAARLKKEGLTPSPEADRSTLLRRASLIVTGLPPTLEEMESFLSDPRDTDTAYLDLVERLLSSLRYGEHWAQHWLDVIRWAETVGFETNAARPNAWHYRDWLIDALNRDLPYDQFLFRQIAGDTVNDDAALGFLVAGPANLPGQVGRDEESMRQARQDELDEVMRTVGQSVMGLTVGCARCHTHKFDPITLRDYYGLQAVFAGLNYGNRRLRGEQNDQWTAKIPDAKKHVSELEARLKRMQADLKLLPSLSTIQEERFPATEAVALRMEIQHTQNRKQASLYELQAFSTEVVNVASAAEGGKASASSFALENQSRHPDNLIDDSLDRRQDYPWKAATSGPAWAEIEFAKPTQVNRIVWHAGASIPVDYVLQLKTTDGEWVEVADTLRRLPREDDGRSNAQIQLKGLGAKQVDGLMALIKSLRSARRELSKLSAGPQTYAARFTEPQVTWVLKRGEPMQRTTQIAPSTPEVLGDLGLSLEAEETQRRVSFARHLIHPENPLTSRVMVNRIWQYNFGTGLVETSSDFGKMGAQPSHPELLDWLASEFIKNEWSLKDMHRLILTSSTFRQDSRPRKEAMALDANTRLLWRYPRQRMQAEMIRDSILATSGRLNLKMYGVGFDFFNQKGGLSDYRSHETFDEKGWRRMVYATKVRMQSVAIFGSFDCPDGGQMAPLRPSSVTPIQALGLMNSPFIQRQADFLAKRLQSKGGDSLKAQTAMAIQLAFNREATDTEINELAQLAKEHGLRQICRVLFNANEFLSIP